MTKKPITPAEFVAKLTARGWRLATIVEDGQPPRGVLVYPPDRDTMTWAERRFFNNIVERAHAAGFRPGQVSAYLHKKSLFFTSLPGQQRFGIPYVLLGL